MEITIDALILNQMVSAFMPRTTSTPMLRILIRSITKKVIPNLPSLALLGSTQIQFKNQSSKTPLPFALIFLVLSTIQSSLMTPVLIATNARIPVAAHTTASTKMARKYKYRQKSLLQ